MSAFAAVLPISRRLHQDGFLRPGPLSLRASIVASSLDAFSGCCQVSHRLDLTCGVKLSCPHAGMNTPSQANTGADSTERLKRYKAGRTIEFLSICPEFEDLQENNFLEMPFTDLVEFFAMQLGYESLEDAYEHYVFREPYGLAALNTEIERLRLAAIAGGEEGHDAVLAHLAASKSQAPRLGKNKAG